MKCEACAAEVPYRRRDFICDKCRNFYSEREKYVKYRMEDLCTRLEQIKDKPISQAIKIIKSFYGIKK